MVCTVPLKVLKDFYRCHHCLNDNRFLLLLKQRSEEVFQHCCVGSSIHYGVYNRDQWDESVPQFIQNTVENLHDWHLPPTYRMYKIWSSLITKAVYHSWKDGEQCLGFSKGFTKIYWNYLIPVFKSTLELWPITCELVIIKCGNLIHFHNIQHNC